MSKKQFQHNIVYSTNPETVKIESQPDVTTLLPQQQKLTVRIESKHRAGKLVTLIEGFVGNDKDREELVKQLKNHCGTGGSAKDGEALLQGDQREKAVAWLLKKNYGRVVKK